MGWIVHDAIVVTSWNKEMLVEAQEYAKSLRLPVSEIVDSRINQYVSFMIAPDGSKEGWEDSDECEAARAKFKQWLATKAYEDGSNSLEYAHVRFGEIETQIVGQQA